MENTTTLTSLLGLTQKQMALLLRVSRSQWSMYESGKRGLPLKARQLLAEMVGFLKFENKGEKVRQYLIEQEEANKKELEKQLRLNEYRQYELTKKVAGIEARYNSNLTAIGLTDYLSSLPNTKQKLDAELLTVIASGAERTIRKSGLAEVTVLRVQQEVLELEKLLLGSALNKVTKTLEKLKEERLSYN